MIANVAAFYEGPEEYKSSKAWVTALAKELHQGDKVPTSAS